MADLRNAARSGEAAAMGAPGMDEEESRLIEEASRVLPADVLELVTTKPAAERLQLLRA